MPPSEDSRTAQGILFMCLAVALFPCLNSSVKYLGAEYATTQIVWARYTGHFLFMLIAFMPRRGLRLFVTHRPGMQVLRSLLLLGSTALYFTALNFLPPTTAAAVSFIAPFVITALSVPLLGEKVGPRRWTAVMVGFAGALIIIRPGLDVWEWASLLVVANATCYAIYQVLTRMIAGQDTPETTITWTALVAMVLTSLAAPLDWKTPDDLRDLALFFGLGVFGGFGHYFVVKAYQWTAASVIAPLGYGQLVGATILGYIVFGEFPDFWTWVGAAVIIGCGIYITYRERRVRDS